MAGLLRPASLSSLTWLYRRGGSVSSEQFTCLDPWIYSDTYLTHSCIKCMHMCAQTYMEASPQTCDPKL